MTTSSLPRQERAKTGNKRSISYTTKEQRNEATAGLQIVKIDEGLAASRVLIRPDPKVEAALGY